MLISLSFLILTHLVICQTFTSARDGVFDDDNTWVGGAAPNDKFGGSTVVNINHDVTFDQEINVEDNAVLNISGSGSLKNIAQNKKFKVVDNGTVNAVRDMIVGHFDVEDNAYVLMKSKTGVVAQLHSSATQWRHLFNLEITMEKGSLVLGGLLTGSKSYGEETLTIITADPENDKGAPRESISKYNEDVSWDNEIKYFAKALQEKSPIIRGSINDAIETMKLIEKIYKADPIWQEKYYK